MSDRDRPTDLSTEYAQDPIGVDEPNPTFRWRVATDRRGACQSAARVLVASAPVRLSPRAADVWDSGKQCSARPAIEYDGPPLAAGCRYYWTVRVWNEADRPSEWSQPATWEMGLSEADWEASWIRRAGTDQSSPFSCFRRSVAVTGAIERARVFVSASHQYALSINGESVDRGQAFAYPDNQYYKTLDVTDHLGSGENVLGVVHAYHGAGQGRPASKPGLILQLQIDFADGRSTVVVTDENWETTAGPWLDAPLRNEEIAEPVEIIDGRRLSPGWDEPGCDADWESAEVVGTHPTDPWERLVAQHREVTHETVHPESVDRLDSGAVVFDFGRVYPGRPVVRFESGTDGHRVEMRAGYHRTDSGVADTAGTQATDMRYAYVQRAGRQEFRSFNYLGFRYLQIDDPGESLSCEQVSIAVSYNAVPDRNAATFDSSNPVLDEVVELARHSALYGCQEGFVDTPTREKGQFLMDAFNMSRVTTLAFGERRLSRGAIREFVRSHYRYWAATGRLNAVYPNGDGKRDIPEFTAAFPAWVWHYYQVTDDRRVLETAYPVVRAVADYLVRHIDSDTGLVTNISGGAGGPYEAGIVDWPPEMRYGYDRDWPALTTVNLFGVNAFKRAADIAVALDRPRSERAYFHKQHQQLETAVVEYLHDGELFVDGRDAHASSDHASQHANALALATGTVPESSIETVTDHVVDSGMQMGPMMVPWLLEALQTTHRPAAFVELLTDPTADGWANILEQGGTFTWESWHCGADTLSEQARRNRSESHAMGATVFTYVLQVLLGVRFEDHADRRLRVRPPDAGLDAASGRVPTECGAVRVFWERNDGLDLTVTIPWNTTASVVVPSRSNRIGINDTTVAVNRSTEVNLSGVDAVRDTGDAVVVDVTTGTYRITTD
ncbi:family 78 glycoside hydrolase catalytic domain [Halocatena pleomorpha]|uniref:alpha-L-rhamnosidase n=1 Tax=Halocatena pleomorpha TaxID=1785090 RepID=A0A3P3R9F9_9EURY|nr:family 78 glycoside hydrolase catalytic domain [Halocatena pleomorpha]RRJ30112.1 alpha-L-rhamnosidase [Halocatena pleomorpha]